MFSQFDNEEVEAYFNRLNAQIKKMPPEDRAELHQEVRQHLDALAAAHEELGATPREAAVAALRQFGDPKRIGRRMFQEWRSGTRRRFRGHGRVILVVGGLFSLLMPLGRVFAHSWIGVYNIILLPVLIGIIAGFCFGRPAMRIVLRMLLFMLTLFTLINEYSGWWCGDVVGPTADFNGSFAFVWLPLGGLSARLGGKARELIDKRRATTS